jgi:hypothetical protein
MQKSRRTISVAGTTYDSLRDYALRRNESMSGIVERLIAAEFEHEWSPEQVAIDTSHASIDSQGKITLHHSAGLRSENAELKRRCSELEAQLGSFRTKPDGYRCPACRSTSRHALTCLVCEHEWIPKDEA